ncbi:MAG: glycosyltransferase family 39 protein [Caldilineaceae bacterium]|nr:glycosyltransferase family 39 protein [Caldilineaceae bacterium]
MKLVTDRSTRTGVILIFLFLAAWLPRVMGLSEFVTIDERKWLARSANFTYALSRQEWSETFQREHPGVTVMWAGSLGLLREYPDYAADAPGYFAWDREYLEAWLAETGAHDPLDLLAAGRWWIVLAISLTLALSFLPLRRLFGEIVAICGTLYLAWTPFYVALSRQLHPDGLVSSLTFFALLLFLAWLYAGRRLHLLIASGAVMGLAWLTKTPAIFLAPAGALLMAVEWRREYRAARLAGTKPAHAALRWLGWLALWGGVATAVFVVLWPAMWVDPLETLLRMAGEMGEYVERHTNVNFFMGRPVEDPGILFYPVAYLFRSTPLTWLGLAAAAIAAWRRQLPFTISRIQQATMGLLLFALLFTAGMSVGAKKFDRYLLPALLALDMVAVLGYWALAFRLRRHMTARAWTQHPLVPAWIIGGAALLHGVLGFVHYPYYFTYYNPLVGGSWTAPRTLFVGWGEGLDQAAEYLNQQPDAENLRVAAWYHDGPFSYFFDGQEVALSSDSPLFWLGTDYAVLYVNQWQREEPSPQAIDYFFAREPVHTVRSGGIELARIYDLRAGPVPDFVEIGKTRTADFGERIRLAAYEVDPLTVTPGDAFHATFYLQSLAEMELDYNVQVRMVGENGQEIWKTDGWPWGAPTSNWPIREIRPDGYIIVVPGDTPPGLYQITLAVYDPVTLERLPIANSATGAPMDVQEQPVALVRVGSLPWPVPVSPPETIDNFGNVIRLADADLPATAAAGLTLDLHLYWESLAPTSTDYTVFAHVMGPDGEQVAGLDRPPRNGFAATSLWQSGQRIVDNLEVELPADLQPGRYEVRVGLYTQEEGRLPLLHDGEVAGDSIRIGTFEAP